VRQTFERELVDIFRLQAEIASSVVARLPVLRQTSVDPEAGTGNLQAYEYYLRGRHYFYLWDGRSLEYAKLMYRKAIDLDPAYAKAWAGLAETLTGTRMWQDDGEALLTEATQASLRAVELAPELAESRSSRGFVLSLAGEYKAAAAEFEAAIRCDPMLYEAWYLYGRCRFAEGEMHEAARLFRHAGTIRPDEYQASCLAVLALQRCADAQDIREAAEDAIRRCRRRLERALAPHVDDDRLRVFRTVERGG